MAPPSQNDAAPNEQDRLVDALAQTAFATIAVLNQVSADRDLSLTQLRVLAILRDRRVRMAALAGHLGLEKSTMTGLVDRAEKKRLLRRTVSATDGRAVDVGLGPAGVELAQRLAGDVRRALGPMTSHLGPADRRRLRVLLERMLGLSDAA